MSEIPLKEPAAEASEAVRTAASAFSHFAVEIANQQIVKVGDTLIGAADSLDQVLERSGVPFGQDLHSFLTSSTARLRKAESERSLCVMGLA